MPNREVAEQFRAVGEELARRGLVTTHGGNLSVRTDGGFWITGTGKRLGSLTAADLAFVGDDGTAAGPAPSSDTAIHAAVYRVAGAGAVAHAHPACATAWSLAVDPFVPIDHEGILILGAVPVVPQDEAVAETVAATLLRHRAVLVRGHGAYAAGEDLWQAAHFITALEESARIAWYHRLLQ
ncbi:L-fuculose phosphate aldolase [bacterium HR29]|nr:L-fuculose phosphate aldolase [bacterium HR29]